MNIPVQRIYAYSRPTRIGVYPVTVNEMGVHLRLDSDVLAAETDYIESLIIAATNTAEHWTKRTFVASTFIAYLDDFFCDFAYTIRKSPLISLDSIQYYKTGEATLSTIDSAEYRTTFSEDFSEVYPINSWPDDIDNRRQSIVFSFTAGYPDDTVPDPDASTVPEDIKNAIKQHVAAMWAKRGDCSQGSEIASGALPAYSKTIYANHRIMDLWVGR